MSDHLLLVFTNSVSGQDDAFNDWYDSRHLADVLTIPGVAAAQRYDLTPMALPDGDDPPEQLPRYLTVYELDREPDAVMKELVERAGTDRMPMSDALDLTTVRLAAWTPSGPRVVAG